MRSALLLALVGAAAGCVVETVDLTDSTPASPGPVVCDAGTRINPATGRCESCIVRTPAPQEACLCDWSYHASPFPYCEGDAVDFDCLPCTGPITSCNTLDASTGAVSSCDDLKSCCYELAAAGAPCCAASTNLWCPTDPLTQQQSWACCACVGIECTTDLDCEVGQTCDTTQTPARCTPPCLATEYCSVDEGCQCRPRPV